jgi:hypothetical protein
MNDFILWFQNNWIGIIAVYLATHKFAVAVRDVLDKTPDTDDNLFEKAVTIMGKLASYLITAKRPGA